VLRAQLLRILLRFHEKKKLFLSTTAGDARLRRSRGWGWISDSATAYKMDTYFDKCLPIVQEKMLKAERFAFHAACNELGRSMTPWCRAYEKTITTGL
jgi:hypothetical protein